MIATGWAGLALLALALVLMMSTGWATYAVLLGVSTLGAALGLATGLIDFAVLGSLPGRIIGLLEHDLLQALALYALVGALLHRMELADQLYGGLRQLLRPLAPHGASALAGYGLGTLLAPMNGSVGASLITLSRSAAPRWAADGMPPTRRATLVAVASTLGVIVPPSLVLLLLGDAMLRAHTEGLNVARAMGTALATSNVRIVNTQDVLQAALLPGALLWLGWLLLVMWGARRDHPPATTGPRSERWAAIVVPLVICMLLVLVAIGRVRAVEAAATAGLALLAWGAASRRLTWARLRLALDDAMATTGALFALLVAATTFSLLLRVFGTDRLVAQAMAALQGQPIAATLVVMAALLACAFVLDAFELIFLVVPVVMPPLLAQVSDAAWVATLTLLVLQAGFLLPPIGYAVVLARGQVLPRPGGWEMARTLAPYLAWLAVVGAVVLLAPQTTRWLRSAPTDTAPASMNADDVDSLMRQMSKPSP